MKAPIVRSLEPITLVGGGNVGPDDVIDAMHLAPVCVAADGGARHILAAGAVPEAVIGDMDSLDDRTRDRLPENNLHRIAEQDSTDFDKALRHVSAPLVLGVGFLGGRVDHQWAAFHVLTAYPDRPCVLIGSTELVFLCPSDLTLDCAVEDVVSLMPMAPVTGRSTGLVWPIDGLSLDPLSRIGTSNRAEGPITLAADAPHMLVIVPRARLEVLTQALALAPQAARWPARAERYRAPQQP